MVLGKKSKLKIKHLNVWKYKERLKMRYKILVKAPSRSQSGYGEQSKFALRALRKHQDKFDIKLLNLNWGRTGFGLGLSPEEKEENEWLDNLIQQTSMEIQQNQGHISGDISLQITIPNEFEGMAPINIGYTAGVECNKASPEWLMKCNQMNKVLVTSNHAKFVLESTSYDGQDQFGKPAQLKLEKPVITTPYAVRPEISADMSWINEDPSLGKNLPDFNFLSICQWGPRKNLETTIKAFVEEFKNEDVGLIIKANITKNNIADRTATEFRLKEFLKTLGATKEQRKCKIFLIHGHLSQNQVRGLMVHPKIKALITTSHGEGFGLSQFDAAQLALPQAMPAYSGYLDFMYCKEMDEKSKKMKLRPQFRKIDYDIKPVQPEAVWPTVINQDAQWAFVKHSDTREAMRDIFKNYGPWKAKAKKLQEHVLGEFSADKMYDHFVQQILDCLPALPKEDDTFKLDQEIQEKNILNDIVET